MSSSSEPGSTRPPGTTSARACRSRSSPRCRCCRRASARSSSCATSSAGPPPRPPRPSTCRCPRRTAHSTAPGRRFAKPTTAPVGRRSRAPRRTIPPPGGFSTRTSAPGRRTTCPASSRRCARTCASRCRQRRRGTRARRSWPMSSANGCSTRCARPAATASGRRPPTASRPRCSAQPTPGLRRPPSRSSSSTVASCAR